MDLERELEYWPPGKKTPIPVRLRIGLPEPHPSHGWVSTITIEGFPSKPLDVTAIYGVDPLQALSHALSIASVLLRLWSDRGGYVSWRGEGNLHLPSMHAEPWQDWRLLRTDGTEPRTLTIHISLPEWIDEQWMVFLGCLENGTCNSINRRITADTWPAVLERAAAAAPGVLRELADQLGGGELEEVRPSSLCPACGLDHEETNPDMIDPEVCRLAADRQSKEQASSSGAGVELSIFSGSHEFRISRGSSGNR